MATALLLLSPSFAFADGIEVPTSVKVDVSAFSVEPSGEQLQLSLDDAVKHALHHNVGLAVQRYARRSSLLGVREAMGLYDLNLGADVSTGSNTSPPVSALEAADLVSTETDRWNFNLQ